MAELVKELLRLLLHPFLWVSSRANRARLKGARIEVVAFLLCRKPEAAILLGKSPYHEMWMPPQEGVNMKETFEQALRRCLEVECGLDLPESDTGFSQKFHLRSIRYAGLVSLPEDRHGERLVADDALGTPLEHVVLKRKAYWMATILLASRADIEPHPDGKELIGLQWFSLRDARQVISQTNHADKAALLLKCLDVCERDLHGAPRAILRDDGNSAT